MLNVKDWLSYRLFCARDDIFLDGDRDDELNFKPQAPKSPDDGLAILCVFYWLPCATA